MAAIDRVKIPGVVGVMVDIARNATANEMWKWYDEHKDDVITTVKVWFINIKIHVHELRPLFVMLFGEHTGS